MKAWLKYGLLYAVFMFLIFGIGMPLIKGETMSFARVSRSALLWLVGGLVFGLIFDWIKKKDFKKS